MAFIKVLLPAPLGLKIPVSFPNLIMQLTSRKASCLRKCTPKWEMLMATVEFIPVDFLACVGVSSTCLRQGLNFF